MVPWCSGGGRGNTDILLTRELSPAYVYRATSFASSRTLSSLAVSAFFCRLRASWLMSYLYYSVFLGPLSCLVFRCRLASFLLFLYQKVVIHRSAPFTAPACQGNPVHLRHFRPDKFRDSEDTLLVVRRAVGSPKPREVVP